MDIFQKTKELCEIYNIKPARSKGQNFLIMEDDYEKIIESAELSKSDDVLEVGPGLGFLTTKLSKEAGSITAVELDDKLADVLQTGLITQGLKNVKVVNENILDMQECSFGKAGKYKVVANLPYNITSVFLRRFLTTECKPELMVLMLQKEVGERITAKPGKMSLLAVSVQLHSRPEIISSVPKNNFWPAPKVDSVIIKIKIRKNKFNVNEKNFFRLVKIGFSAKRKMLKNNLVNGYHISNEDAEERLKKAGFNKRSRAQELSVEDWIMLLNEF